MNKVEELTRVMARLSAGSDPDKIKVECKDIFAAINPMDIALAGQNLLESGMFFGDFCSLCRKHLAMIGDPAAVLKKELPASHVMHLIFDQHKNYLAVLASLEEINIIFRTKADMVLQSPEFERLLQMHEQFGWINRHMEFEQNVLLPELYHAGFEKLVKLINYQHIDLGQCYEGLGNILRNFAQLNAAQFRNRYNSIIQSMVTIGRMHITIEEVVLYPIILEVVTNPAIWDKCKLIPGPLKQSA